jgi:hypothetical protein
VKRRLVVAQSLHHHRGQIVLSVRTPRIATRNEKESRSLFDHHPSRVCVRPNVGALFDVHSKAEQIGKLIAEPGGIVLATTPFHESL